MNHYRNELIKHFRTISRFAQEGRNAASAAMAVPSVLMSEIYPLKEIFSVLQQVIDNLIHSCIPLRTIGFFIEIIRSICFILHNEKPKVIDLTNIDNRENNENAEIDLETTNNFLFAALSDIDESSVSSLENFDQVNIEDQLRLRKKIQIIMNSSKSEREKAFLNQSLLMEKFRDNEDRKKQDSMSNSQELSVVDLAKTYNDKINNILGCEHYSRKCKLKCSQCQDWTNCRFCHDEKWINGKEDFSSHTLDRFKTKEMLCMICLTAQPAAQHCKKCTTRMAYYYCDICKFWDDDSRKDIYHCNDCHICRLGKGIGKDYFHCSKCNICMAINLEDSHNCIERATECNCPICEEWLFNSIKNVCFMRCGHAIHQSCYCDYIKTSYRCPTCFKTLWNMDHTFRLLQVEILRQPMPQPYCQWVASIICNDCHTKSQVPHHFLGHMCRTCSSFNTRVDKICKPQDPNYNATFLHMDQFEARADNIVQQGTIDTNQIVDQLGRSQDDFGIQAILAHFDSLSSRLPLSELNDLVSDVQSLSSTRSRADSEEAWDGWF